jgi:hypothetical protein
VVQLISEPVHWASRLRVVEGAPYTEVAGCALAVVPSTANVVLLAAETGTLVSRLDGRPLCAVLAEELAGWGDDERRPVIEVLRRLKAVGLLEDAPPGAAPRPVPWLASARATEVTVAAASAATAPRPSPGEPLPPGRIALLAVACDDGPDLHDAGTKLVTLRADGAEAAAAECLVVPVEPGRRTDGGPSPLQIFAALVTATAPRAQLTEPGVLDLLAELAETVPAEWASV